MDRVAEVPDTVEARAIAYGARAGRVYDWILGRILTTELAPGSFIDKAAVAASIGVSKQPVTVALARLAREGWVEIESRVGSYVARVDPAALREIAFVWFAALALVAHDLVSHPDAELSAQLRPPCQSAVAALAEGNIQAALTGLRAAESCLIDRLGNLKARRYYDHYRAHFGRYMRHVEATPSVRPLARAARRDAIAAGLALFDAIERGDLEGIAKACAAIEDVHTVYLDRITALG